MQFLKTKRQPLRSIFTAVGLDKIARHLALLTCLFIVSKANGWSDTGAPAILSLAAAACLLHLAAGWLRGCRRTGPKP